MASSMSDAQAAKSGNNSNATNEKGILDQNRIVFLKKDIGGAESFDIYSALMAAKISINSVDRAYKTRNGDLVVELLNKEVAANLKINGLAVKGTKLMPLTVDGNINVKIQGVSRHISLEEIKSYFSNFGEVNSIKEEVANFCPAWKTGIINLRMVIQREIPYLVYLKKEELTVTYRNLSPYCFICRGLGHVKKDCPRLNCGKCGFFGHFITNVQTLM